MALKTSSQGKKPTEVWAPFPYQDGNPFVHAADIQTRCAKTVLEWQIEMVNFLKFRLVKDVAFVEALSKPQRPSETLSGISDYMLEAIDDYSHEAAKAATFGSRMTVDTANQVKKKTEDLVAELKSAATAGI